MANAIETGKVEKKPSVLGDVVALAGSICDDDLAEAEALGGEADELLLGSFMRSSDRYSLFDDKGILCMYGVSGSPMHGSTESRLGFPWMIHCDRLSLYPVMLIEETRASCKLWMEKYEILTNIVHKDNKRSRSYLEAVGFKFDDEPVPMLAGFVRFWMGRD